MSSASLHTSVTASFLAASPVFLDAGNTTEIRDQLHPSNPQKTGTDAAKTAPTVLMPIPIVSEGVSFDASLSEHDTNFGQAGTGGGAVALGRVAVVAAGLVPSSAAGDGERAAAGVVAAPAVKVGNGGLYTHVTPGIQHTASIAFPGLWAEGDHADMLQADSKFALRLANQAETAVTETLAALFAATGDARRRQRTRLRGEIGAKRIADARYHDAWARFCAAQAARRELAA